MAVRIRVYPQGMGAMGAMGGYGMNQGGVISASTYFNSKLQAQKQVGSLQLGYERALANERIERARLEERAKNPYAMGAAGMSPYGMGMPIGAGFGGINPLAMAGVNPLMGGLGMGVPTGYPMGGLPIGGVPGGFPGGGQGQTNFTSQVGAGSQSVTNSNVLNVSRQQTMPPYGAGYPGFGGGGGFLSGLLGALI